MTALACSALQRGQAVPDYVGSAPMAVVPGRLAVYANADARSSVVVAAQMSAADGDRAMLNGLHQVYGAATRRAVVRMITEAADGVLELLATRG